MGRVLLVLLVIGMIGWGITSAFFKLYTDPFGMTTRAEVRSYTAIETTRLETQAAVDIASLQAHAQIESTRLLANAAKVEAQEQRKTAQVWASVLPLLLLIVVVGGAVWLFIMYQGRMMLILAQKGIALPYWFPSVPQGWQQPEQRASRASETKRSWAEQDPAEALQRYAAVHNLEVRQENGYYLLVDRTTHQVVKQLTLRNW